MGRFGSSPILIQNRLSCPALGRRVGKFTPSGGRNLPYFGQTSCGLILICDSAGKIHCLAEQARVRIPHHSVRVGILRDGSLLSSPIGWSPIECQEDADRSAAPGESRSSAPLRAVLVAES
jgi:hypothetical protein